MANNRKERTVEEKQNEVKDQGFWSDKNASERAPEKKPGIWSEIVSYLVMVAVIMAAMWTLTHFVIVNARIPSGSMENTIMTGDRLIGTRFTYWFKGPKRGDIVLFHWPVDPKTIYIKRCIGLPGETVTIKDGGVYINDSKTPLKEKYLKEEWVEANDGFVFHVPKDSYLMLGDNRNNSQDSRYWAEVAMEEGVAKNAKQAQKYTYVKKSQIMARAWFRYKGGFKDLTRTAGY
ncbi:signal peptidase I [Candidatus Weimeria sp. HCP3S3_B5]|uniref:signal peptidase I n=1 Tax=Candidatus Weimeria sp. HCP3S3_B5 TaxID=3438871 RepID=UPI0030491B54|nr:signal peptidase I [Lachnospiraceae bacterium]